MLPLVYPPCRLNCCSIRAGLSADGLGNSKACDAEFLDSSTWDQSVHNMYDLMHGIFKDSEVGDLDGAAATQDWGGQNFDIGEGCCLRT